MKYANQVGFSDVRPFKVLSKESEKLLLIQEMSYTEVNSKKLQESFIPGGFLGTFNNSLQEWVIKPNGKGQIVKIRLHKSGNWKDKNGNKYVLADVPVRHYDYNF